MQYVCINLAKKNLLDLSEFIAPAIVTLNKKTFLTTS